MDLNAFLPSLEISGSTLDFVGMPLEIAMDSFVWNDFITTLEILKRFSH